jgi:hypothetical protein
MPTYRAYKLDRARHIKSAEWIEAPNDLAAKDQAQDLCDEEAPTIEVWQQARRVDEIDCEDDA